MRLNLNGRTRANYRAWRNASEAFLFCVHADWGIRYRSPDVFVQVTLNNINQQSDLGINRLLSDLQAELPEKQYCGSAVASTT